VIAASWGSRDSNSNRHEIFASGNPVSQGCESPFAPLKWPFSPGRDALNFQTDEAIHAYFPPCTGQFRAPVRFFGFDYDDRLW
jgi:hypothetical protein